MRASAGVSAPEERPRRADIQALRALAVVLVVIFHVRPGVFAGGFAGVDAFFVISGFVIGAVLVAELVGAGRVRLATFYARRVRRIVPLSAFVAAVTLASFSMLAPATRFALWGNPLGEASIPRDGIAATLAVSNLWQWYLGEGYNVVDSATPFLHYWSLGVEEQFYVVAPLALGLLMIVSRRSLKGLAIGVAVWAAASFAAAVVIASEDPVNAYYNPATRGWELGVGVLLAIGLNSRAVLVPKRVGYAIAAAGTAALVAFALVGDEKSWPSWPALVPVVAVVAVILGLTGRSDGWWSVAALQRLGDWSYGIYLWHWPVLLALPLLAGAHTTWWVAALAEIGVVGLAAATFRWVEAPARRLRVDSSGARARIFALGVGAVVAVILVAVLVAWDARRELQSLAGPGPSAAAPATTEQASPGASTGPTPLPSQPPAALEFASSLPVNVRPALADAAQDLPASYADHCHAGQDTVIPLDCAYGDGALRVVLFGDSHAAQWLGSFTADPDLTVISVTKSGCPPIALVAEPGAPRWGSACDEWRANAFRTIAAAKPDVIVMAAFAHYHVADGADPVQQYPEQLARTIAGLPAGVKVAYIADTPSFDVKPLDCAAQHPADLASCAVKVEAGYDVTLNAALREAAEAAGATYVDSPTLLCPEGECGVVWGDVFMYRDTDHVTNTFAVAVGERLRALALGAQATPSSSGAGSDTG